MASLLVTSVPLPITSPETVLLLPLMSLPACRTTATALVSAASVMLGSPTLAEWETSGACLKLPMMRPKRPISERLASSALFAAIASLVGSGTVRPSACKRFFASAARSDRG